MQESELIFQLITLWDSLPIMGRIVVVLLILHPVMSVVTVLTPTPKDDALWSAIYHKVIRPLALNIGKSREK